MRIHNDRILRLVSAVGDLDDSEVRHAVAELALQGMQPLEIQKSIDIGMKLVFEYYRSGEYFVSDLFYAGYIYNEVLRMDAMRVEPAGGKFPGKIVIGTLPGEIHDIGKNIVANTLRANGFEVIDVGIGPSAERFIEVVCESVPDTVAISTTLPGSLKQLERLIQSLRAKARDDLKILTGGNGSLAEKFRDVGADAYGKDEIAGLEYCLSVARSGDR